MTHLVVSILAHAALGIALAVATWLAGGWIARRLPGGLGNAYPAGLLILSAAAFLVLVTPLLAPVAVAGTAVAVWLGARAAGRRTIATAGRSLLGATPGAFGFALALGLFQHGPDAERGSNAFGDLVFYVAELIAATRSVVPFSDLSVAGYEHTYLQAAPAFVGAAVEPLPGFDPFLFFAAALPAFMFAALAVGIGVVGEEAGRSMLVPAALAAGALAYPTWVSESPPVALAAPVVFGFCAFLAAPAAWTAVLPAAALVATKVVGILPLAAIVAASTAPRLVQGRGRDRLTVAGAVLVVAVAAALALRWVGWLGELVTLDFLPRDAFDGVEAQLETRSTQALAPALLVCGQLLLAGGVVRLRQPLLLAAVAVGIAASWLIGGHASDIAFLLPVLLVALQMHRGDDTLTTAVLATAAACLLLAAAFREVAGLGTGVVLLVLAATSLAGAFASSTSAARVAVLAALAAVTVAGAAVAGLLRLDAAAQPLTSDHYDVWSRVDELAPPGAIVFTSLTGPEIETDAGWNYYAAAAGRRQLYVAGWASSELRVRPQERDRRLLLNSRALRGDTRDALADSGLDDRTALYAVVRTSEEPPDRARLLYENDRFALYELGRP